METVLIVGSTGHIGLSAVLGALRSQRRVLAVVRNQASADKLVKRVGSADGITFVEADVLSDTGVRGVVQQVREGKLPAFQHVYACVGGLYEGTPLTEITTAELRRNMSVSFESNFFAYRETIPYLLEQNHPASTWTLATGAQGDIGMRPLPGMTQGALFTMALAGCRENEHTNVRFVESYIFCRIEVDDVAAQNGTIPSSEFAIVYEQILARQDIRSVRVVVRGVEDFKELTIQKRF